MLRNILAIINTSRFKDRKEDKLILGATTAFQCLMAATADAIEIKEEGLYTGIIPSSMSLDTAIPYLFASDVFFHYEKNYSPIMASNLLRIYCPNEFFSVFELNYRRLSDENGIDIRCVDFQNDSIVPIIDIAGSFTKCFELGYKRHWNPFKEPYRSQWDFCFESKLSEGYE